LDRLIDEIDKSGIAKALSQLMAHGDAGSPGNMWTSLRDRVKHWTAQLEPQRKAQAEQFIAAVQGNLLLRTLRASFGTSG
jgi:hypothetical protein